MDINEILQLAVDKHASDIFIVAGTKLAFKIDGIIQPIGEEKLTPDRTRTYVEEIYRMSSGVRKSIDMLDNIGEDDFSFSLSKVGRFRVNAYYQRGSLAAVLRVVRFKLPDPEVYHISPSILELSKLNKGLVLVTGSAGSGKSTTLACIVDEINKTKNDHIITIEDPIEYLHSHNRSIVSQREIGHDTKDYLIALRAALREAPNVILVGEMRDLETVSVALNAAETGHLVLSTLHTMGASETISRIVDMFPSNQQEQIRIQLAMVLQAVVSQQLVRGVDGKMYPSFEIMKACPAIRTQMRENKLHLIDNTISQNKDNGMITMDDSLMKLYKDGIIDKDTLLQHANNPEQILKKIN